MVRYPRFAFHLMCALLSSQSAFCEPAAPIKTQSVLFPERLVNAAVMNAKTHEWARKIQETVVAQAKPWLDTSDQDLWSLMFGPGLTRSWMVWSDGVCPSCGKDVKMYTWKIDIWNHRFKVQCPHCDTFFPTSDFEAFYSSGLDSKGLFDPAKADRSLLYNAEHPDPNDPLHLFGVDDGEGFVKDGKRWRFIGYYLIAGQWRQLVVGGIRALSEAYGATGDPVYARKAAILLDRVADFYPQFDFKSQGLVYEKAGHEGAVTVWHDACEEIRELAQAYDRIFDAAAKDDGLVEFLHARATEQGLENTKTSFAEIQTNIENRVLRETLARPERIRSNYPRTPIALLTVEAVLGWPDNWERVMSLFSEMLNESIQENGVTGEKGIAGYSTIFPGSFAVVAMRFDRASPGFLNDLFQRYPALYRTYRFHIDTWCLQKYYPALGDAGCFGTPVPLYKGVFFGGSSTEPSMHSFLWRVYEITRDPAFVQALYGANGNSVEDLPHDLFAGDPKGFQREVQEVINQNGAEIPLGDVNMEEWGISILRAGRGENRRALWLDHDAGGRHGHRGGLNLGLFAKGLDLLPDFGYPPVGYGGWTSPKALWYTKTAGHDTVVIDGQDHKTGKGQTTLWASGKKFHLARVAAPNVASASTYERSVALIDLDEEDSWIIDIFRINGGSDHAKFLSAFYGTVATCGLNLGAASQEYGYDTENRGFRSDPNPQSGWSVDWTIEDRLKQREGKGPVHLRYTDLTAGAEASLGECWIVGGLYGGQEEWIPRLMARRRNDHPPLSSCFVSVLEPYGESRKVRKVVRLDTGEKKNDHPSEESVALECHLEDGMVQVYAETGKDVPALILENGLHFQGKAAWVSSRDGKPQHLALSSGDLLRYGGWTLRLKQPVDLFEVEIVEGVAKIVTGNPEWVDRLQKQ